jgi:hypothetical protein
MIRDLQVECQQVPTPSPMMTDSNANVVSPSSIMICLVIHVDRLVYKRQWEIMKYESSIHGYASPKSRAVTSPM